MSQATAPVNVTPIDLPTPRVQQLTQQIGPLRGRYPKSKAEADHAADALKVLQKPASPRSIARCVSTLVNDPAYFQSAIPEPIREAQMQTWIELLSPFPTWAIESACKWWVSAQNPYRHRIPVAGDIESRCEDETTLIRVGQKMIEAYARHGDNPPAFFSTK